MSFRSFDKILPEYSVGQDIVVGVATPYVLDSRGIESRWGVGVEISRTSLNRAWGPTSLLYSGYRVCFPEENGPGRGVGHPPQSITEFRERVELYTHLTLSPYAFSRVNFSFLKRFREFAKSEY